MAYPAIENQDLDNELIEAVSSGEKTDKQALDLFRLKNEVRKKLDSAGELFTDEDRKRWEKKLAKIEVTDESDLKTLATQIEREAEEIKDKTSEYVRRIQLNSKFFGRGTAREYIDEFKRQPFETKLTWFEKLDEELAGLRELYEEAKATLTTNEFERFKKLRRHQKRNLLEEIRESKKKITDYTAILRQNSSVFGKGEIKKLEADFRDMTAAKQAEAARNLFKEEIQPRIRLRETYGEFPESYRRLYSRFVESDMQGKEKIIEQMKTQLEHDYQRKLFAAAISIESKQAALSWFVGASIKMRGEALKALDKQVDVEDRINNEFERLMDEYYTLLEKNEERPRLAREFYNSQYKEKQEKVRELSELIAKRKTEKAETKKLVSQYEGMLKAEVRKRVLSEKTMERYLEKFAEHDLEAKRSAIYTFEAEMAPRRALLARFEKEFPDTVKKKHGREFYGTGHHGRMVKFEQLRKIYAKEIEEKAKEDKKAETKKEAVKKAPDINTQIKDLKHEAMVLQIGGNSAKALKLYEQAQKLSQKIGHADDFCKQQIIKLKKKLGYKVNAKEDKEKPQEKEIEQILKKQMKSGTIRKARKNATVIKKAALIVDKSDKETQAVDAARKTRKLSSAQIKLQETLVRKHKKILQDGKAVNIEEVDIEKGIDNLDQTNAVKLAEAIGGAEDRIKMGKTADNFQLVNSGNKLSGQAGKIRAKEVEKQTKTEIRKRVVRDLELIGRKVDSKKLQDIKKTVKGQNLDIDLMAA
jgi:hypothetical protein